MLLEQLSTDYKVAEYLGTLISEMVMDKESEGLWLHWADLGISGVSGVRMAGSPATAHLLDARTCACFRRKAIPCKLPLTFKVMVYHLLSK